MRLRAADILVVRQGAAIATFNRTSAIRAPREFPLHKNTLYNSVVDQASFKVQAAFNGSDKKQRPDPRDGVTPILQWVCITREDGFGRKRRLTG